MSATRLRLAAACLTSLLTATAGHAQSLGEIAKKAQEQRDKAKADAPPAKTYTNKDLVALPSREPAASPGSSLPREGRPQQQVLTLFEFSQQRDVGAQFFVAGVGYVSINGGGSILAGMNRALDPFVELTIAGRQDPMWPACRELLVPASFVDQALRIGGTGTFQRHPGVDGRQLVVLRLDKLSECKLVPRG
jgi:hypothetical protein